MLQIAICDDEKFYREKLKALLEKYLKKHNMPYSLHTFLSGEKFLEQCENSVKFDIVFLDISMERIDGIQTAMRIRSFTVTPTSYS